MATLRLVSAEGETFEVEEEIACMSMFIKQKVADSGTDEEIPCPI